MIAALRHDGARYPFQQAASSHGGGEDAAKPDADDSSANQLRLLRTFLDSQVERRAVKPGVARIRQYLAAKNIDAYQAAELFANNLLIPIAERTLNKGTGGELIGVIADAAGVDEDRQGLVEEAFAEYKQQLRTNPAAIVAMAALNPATTGLADDEKLLEYLRSEIDQTVPIELAAQIKQVILSEGVVKNWAADPENYFSKQEMIMLEYIIDRLDLLSIADELASRLASHAQLAKTKIYEILEQKSATADGKGLVAESDARVKTLAAFVQQKNFRGATDYLLGEWQEERLDEYQVRETFAHDVVVPILQKIHRPVKMIDDILRYFYAKTKLNPSVDLYLASVSAFSLDQDPGLIRDLQEKVKGMDKSDLASVFVHTVLSPLKIEYWSKNREDFFDAQELAALKFIVGQVEDTSCLDSILSEMAIFNFGNCEFADVIRDRINQLN